MSLEKIIASIMAEATAQADAVTREAARQADTALASAQAEALRLYDELLGREHAQIERYKQKVLVAARLEARKRVLQEKQALIGEVFNALKAGLDKERLKIKEIFMDREIQTHADASFYLAAMRNDYENQAAARLFAGADKR